MRGDILNPMCEYNMVIYGVRTTLVTKWSICYTLTMKGGDTKNTIKDGCVQ